MTRRYIVRRVRGREVRVEITGCFWCGETDNVCAACAKRADDEAARFERSIAAVDPFEGIAT